MKAELVIQGQAPKQIELASSPHAGEVLFIDGHRVSIKEIVHDVSRRKLQVVCNEPNAFESFCHAAAPDDTDVDDDGDD